MSKNSHIWHPMTQHALFPDSINIERAEGAYLYAKGKGAEGSDDERKIIDGITTIDGRIVINKRARG